MFSFPDRSQLAIGTTLVLLLVGGCVGKGKRPLWAQREKRSATAKSESVVLNARQTADVRLALGRTAEQQQNWRAASTIYRQLLEENPRHPEATHRLAILYDRQGDYEQSSQWFQRALKLKPGDPDLFCDIGYSHYSQGRYREAESHLKQAVAVAPDHARSHNHLGLVLAQKGDREGAFDAFRRANCSPAQAHANLAVVLAINNHTQDARRHLLAAQHLKSGDRGIQKRLDGLEMLIASREPQTTPAPVGLPGGATERTVARSTEARPQREKPVTLISGVGSPIPQDDVPPRSSDGWTSRR